MPIEAINLDRAFAKISDHWFPHVVGHLNDQMIKIAKVQGDFIWHSHEKEDEGFLVLSGLLTPTLRKSRDTHYAV